HESGVRCQPGRARGARATPRGADAGGRRIGCQPKQDLYADPPFAHRQEDLAAHRLHARPPAQGRGHAAAAKGGRLMLLAIVIDLEPNLFKIGPLLITWHGVFSVLGILAAARLGLWLLEKDKIDVSHGADGVTWMVVLGLVGTRVLYVWENFKFFSGRLIHVFYITEGGISQWGGLFGAILGAYIWARRAKFSFWKVMDAGGPAAMIGLAVGRIGDVINGEHHGTPTNLPWGVEYVNPDTLGQPGVSGFTYSTPQGRLVGVPWCSPLMTSPMRPTARPIMAAGPPASMTFQNENFARRAQMYAPRIAPNNPPHWLMPPSVM